MRTIFLSLLALGLVSLAGAETEKNPRLIKVREKFARQGLAAVLEQNPSLKADDVELGGVWFMIYSQEGGTVTCGPKGCHWPPSVPFLSEVEVVYFEKSSKRRIVLDRIAYAEADKLVKPGEIINEALDQLLKRRPAIRAENLEATSLQYEFRPKAGPSFSAVPIAVPWGPETPFMETIKVTFRERNTKRTFDDGERSWTEWTGLSVQFPTAGEEKWAIEKAKFSQPGRPARDEAPANSSSRKVPHRN